VLVDGHELYHAVILKPSVSKSAFVLHPIVVMPGAIVGRFIM
jgi:hypothetical protein